MSTVKEKQYLEFKNKGEVPINAFKLLGASTKRADNSKIGFFGTGLKYAIALMLREGIDFSIFIGEKPVRIGVRKTEFAGQKIGVMTVNGEKTSITLDAGIGWKPWFAIREIYSNTIDESGTMELTDSVSPEAGHTTIYIEMSKKFGTVMKDWQTYFAFKRPSIWETLDYRIFEKQKRENFTVFRKGIRAHIYNKKSLFDYDVDNLEINESRVASNVWEPNQRAAEALALCENPDVIMHFLHHQGQGDDFIEHENDFWSYMFDVRFGKFSDAWYEILKDRRLVPAENAGFYGVTTTTIILPRKMLKQLHINFGDKLNIVSIKQEKYRVISDYDKRLDKSYELLKKYGFSYDKEKIKIAKFQDQEVLGMFDDKVGLILLSENVLGVSGAQSKTEVLLEEIIHAQTGFDDNTRSFQAHLVQVLVRIMEENQEERDAANSRNTIAE